MRTVRTPVILGLAIGAFIALIPSECPGAVAFQIRESGSTSVSASVSPGDLLSLDVVATSISAGRDVLGNLDAFTYRVNFPNQEFTLANNAFALPFDDIPAPGGFNGSVPWVGLPVAITFNADAGSPNATPLVADLYRTTATQPFSPISGTDVMLETLTVQVPSPLAGDLPATFSISLNVLEAVDQFGSFHSVNNGLEFLLTVVPEPEETAAFAGVGLVALALIRRRMRQCKS